MNKSVSVTVSPATVVHLAVILVSPATVVHLAVILAWKRESYHAQNCTSCLIVQALNTCNLNNKLNDSKAV